MARNIWGIALDLSGLGLFETLVCHSLLTTVTLIHFFVTVSAFQGAISMENQRAHHRASSVENVTVGGPMREYLTEKEVDRLIEAAKQNRWGHRDATAILIAYRHGLRASELVALRWSDTELQTSRLHVRRAKGG